MRPCLRNPNKQKEKKNKRKKEGGTKEGTVVNSHAGELSTDITYQLLFDSGQITLSVFLK
jgi:hypothetical protein